MPNPLATGVFGGMLSLMELVDRYFMKLRLIRLVGYFQRQRPCAATGVAISSTALGSPIAGPCQTPPPKVVM